MAAAVDFTVSIAGTVTAAMVVALTFNSIPILIGDWIPTSSPSPSPSPAHDATPSPNLMPR